MVPTSMSCEPDRRRCDSILVVDDEDAIRSVLRRTLASRGFRNVLTAKNGHEALRILRRREVALALLDLRMPDMSGQAALRAMRMLDPGLAIVVVTAEDDPEVLAQVKDLGALDCLIKPVAASALVRAVEKALSSVRVPGPVF